MGVVLMIKSVTFHQNKKINKQTKLHSAIWHHIQTSNRSTISGQNFNINASKLMLDLLLNGEIHSEYTSVQDFSRLLAT